jgi:hypothetical protein
MVGWWDEYEYPVTVVVIPVGEPSRGRPEKWEVRRCKETADGPGSFSSQRSEKKRKGSLSVTRWAYITI